MAFTHGKNTEFGLGTSGTPGTATDISTYIDNVDLPESIETADTTTYGTDTKTFIIGLNEASLSISGKWDPTIDAHLAGIKFVDNVAFEYYPEGNTSGKVKYSGVCVMTNYSKSSPVGDVTSFTADFQVSGSVTRATVA